MVVGDGATVFHVSPVLPASGLLAVAWVPDLLAPDDVHDIQVLMVLHDPFSEILALGVVGLVFRKLDKRCLLLYSKRNTYANHEVQGQSLTVLTRLIGVAPDDMGDTWVLREDSLAGLDDVGLAVALWDIWVGGSGAALDVVGFAGAVVRGRDVSGLFAVCG